jgi:cytochrome c oxidase subunit IV
MERDDIIEYSLETHHDEEHGKAIRKKIYFVTILLTAITAVEVLLGAFIKQNAESMTWIIVKWSFILMTLLKAGYIVMVFMHLGDEKKSLRNIILIPYFIFMAYLIFICLKEGLAVNNAWLTY